MNDFNQQVIIGYLEEMLELAKCGKLSGFVGLYIEEDSESFMPSCFSHFERSHAVLLSGMMVIQSIKMSNEYIKGVNFEELTVNESDKSH